MTNDDRELVRQRILFLLARDDPRELERCALRELRQQCRRVVAWLIGTGIAAASAAFAALE